MTTKTQRMNWLDAARLSAAFSIIGIHSTTDSKGKAFAEYETHERIFPVIMRTVSDLASTEFFILVTLFLLSSQLIRKPKPYGETMLLQAKRLLIPFAIWTIFYGLFSLIKANSFGYYQPMLKETLEIGTWINYFALGTAKYHLHFLPTIFIMLLFHPVFKIALRFPLLGLLVIPLLLFKIVMSTWVWGHIIDPVMIEYLDRLVKIIGYLGYGFVAYSLIGLVKMNFDKETSKMILYLSLFFIGVLFLVKLTHAEEAIMTGNYAPRIGMVFVAHTLLPVFLLLAFLGSQHYAWPGKISNWSKYTFGTYLIHPAVIDLIDILMKGHEMAPYQYVLFKYSLTLSVALSLSILISKLSWVAWSIGLGPLPFSTAWKDRKHVT